MSESKKYLGWILLLGVYLFFSGQLGHCHHGSGRIKLRFNGEGNAAGRQLFVASDLR